MTVPDSIDQFRYFLKDHIRMKIDFSLTDQSKGIYPPPIEKSFSPDIEKIPLSPMEEWTAVKSIDLVTLIQNRRSHRIFKDAPLLLEELSFLLWAVQGIREVVNPGTALRTVPSAGCRHALETYLAVSNVTDLDKGLYRYLPLEHCLIPEKIDPFLTEALVKAAYGQSFVGRAPVSFIWTAVPYRMEWRYDKAAHKVIALDAGHVGQNLYLAAGAVGCGACAIAAYHQELTDRFLDIDGEDEFALYMAVVGKLSG